jgi:hypothetical protein
MQSALDAGSERMYPVTATRQQEAMTGLNNLALMLSEALDQMQQQMNSMGSSGGSQCNKPGNSKPEQMQEMIKRQLGLQKKMEEMQKKMQEKNYGGSMRLGSFPAILKKGTIAYKAYGTETISERHRHRYEVNPEYIKVLEDAGLVFSGVSPDGNLMEIAELPK